MNAPVGLKGSEDKASAAVHRDVAAQTKGEGRKAVVEEMKEWQAKRDRTRLLRLAAKHRALEPEERQELDELEIWWARSGQEWEQTGLPQAVSDAKQSRERRGKQ